MVDDSTEVEFTAWVVLLIHRFIEDWAQIAQIFLLGCAVSFFFPLLGPVLIVPLCLVAHGTLETATKKLLRDTRWSGSRSSRKK